MTQNAKWEIELPVDSFCIWVIYQIRMTQFQIDRGISGPGRIKERSKSAYLAFFPNWLDEHLLVGEAIGHGSCADLESLGQRLNGFPWLLVSGPIEGTVDFSPLPGIEERSFPITQSANLGKDRSRFLNTRSEELSSRIPRLAV